MAENALNTIYLQEFIAGFEQRQTLLRDSVTTEADVKGNQAVFLVADSNDDVAVTRGANGLIPASADNETQLTATLAEWHRLERKTRFNILLGQGDQRAIMQMNCMAVINRKIDTDIIAQLDTASNAINSTGSTASVNLATHAIVALGNNDVTFDGNVWSLVSRAFIGYMMQTTEFSSADYVRRQPYEGGPKWKDQPGFWEWNDVKWVTHPKITGNATASEKCYVYHKKSIGHAMNLDSMDVDVGYNGEQDYSYARHSGFFGSKMLQQSGVIQFLHDGSGFGTV